MKIKKILALVLALSLMSVAGCGTKKADEPVKETSEYTEQTDKNTEETTGDTTEEADKSAEKETESTTKKEEKTKKPSTGNSTKKSEEPAKETTGETTKKAEEPVKETTGETTKKSEVPVAETTKKTNESAKETTKKANEPIKIAIKLKDGRQMKGELYPDIAPISVENFVNLIEKNFFDGLVFHRVISGFMIQGGGFDESFYEGNFNSKETAPIKGEFAANGVKNDLKHTPGVLSMARTSEPDSGSSQFFIMHQTSPHLDGQYAAFGKITEGLDIVDEIANTETTALTGKVLYQGKEYPQQMTDIPKKPIVIKTIDIIE